MNSVGPVGRRFLKRHSEAIFIVAFVLADCFLSGWALAISTAAVILYALVPAIVTVYRHNASARITYLKSFIKTPVAQRLAFLLFWIYSIRFLVSSAMDSNLFYLQDAPATATPAAMFGSLLHEWAPLTYLSTPIFIYLGASVIAILLRSRLKATKQDPDLIVQRQGWSATTQILFLSAFVASVLSITVNASGPSYMISNWLLASGRDANLWSDYEPMPVLKEPHTFMGPQGNEFERIPATEQGPTGKSGPGDAFSGAPLDGMLIQQGGDSPDVYPQPPTLHGVSPDIPITAFIKYFDTFVLSVCSLAAFVLLLQPALRLNALFTSFCWRVVSPGSLQNIIEAFLQALRLPARSLNFREARPFWSNAVRTLVWLVSCFLGLFWLFGFCGGPLGNAIQNWMLASVVDAGIAPSQGAPDWIFEPNLRIFIGSIVALYGTAPIAVSAAVLLPYAKPRKIILNSDGLSFAQGPFLTLSGRQFRLWSDLKSMTVIRSKQTEPRLNAKFTFTFRSGGHITFTDTQITPQDLKVLLDCIDQHAVACQLDPETLSVCRMLLEADGSRAASDGITDSAIDSIAAQEFKSTIFVPLAAGECLPGTKTRIIKQLSSKPLCAVYLGRNEDGRMVTIKQFYLPEDNDETRALAKILNREYELLRRLDHPGIAKVLNSFSADNSTYLVIEHRLGIDLRSAVQEHGPRAEDLTIAWARQLCRIMIYLHSCEPVILHRDVTPDNVIAGEDGQLRLIDFGAAREFLDGITGTMIGKHCYVAPEQLRGDANQRSDIYSFGGTLYFLLTGRDPIALCQSSPAKTVECSEPLNKLIKDCTEFDEQNRPQSFTEVLQRLNEIDHGFRLKLPASKEKAFA